MGASRSADAQYEPAVQLIGIDDPRGQNVPIGQTIPSILLVGVLVELRSKQAYPGEHNPLVLTAPYELQKLPEGQSVQLLNC